MVVVVVIVRLLCLFNRPAFLCRTQVIMGFLVVCMVEICWSCRSNIFHILIALSHASPTRINTHCLMAHFPSESVLLVATLVLVLHLERTFYILEHSVCLILV